MVNGKSSDARRQGQKATWLISIIVAATAAGMICAWRAPGLENYARDSLMRARGSQTAPDDIVIVAIDEASLARLGRFPWARRSTAQVVKAISDGQPNAIALDVLYSEATTPEDDSTLADSIKNAKNVVIAAQLVSGNEHTDSNRSEWLRPVPEIGGAAAGVGHTNVETESDGAARELLLRLGDDEAQPFWALAVETIRVGDSVRPEKLHETANALQLGNRIVPVETRARTLTFKKDVISQFDVIEPLRMQIDYIGAAGAFSNHTYSFVDVLDRRVPPETFRGKYVLIGATAATLGDRIATPFVHAEDQAGNQHGELMPGVEILANEINTILRSRFYGSPPQWMNILLVALVAVAVIGLLGAAQGRFEAVKQLLALAGLIAAILFISYGVFAWWLIIPPVVPAFVSFAIAAPLTLLHRSLSASASLDRRIAALLFAENQLFTNGRSPFSSKTEARLAESAKDFETNGNQPENKFSGSKSFFPRGLEWKSQILEFLSNDLIARALFVDRALRSVEDGLLIADREGIITFANRSVSHIFNLSERRLIGSNIFDRLAAIDERQFNLSETQSDMLGRLLIDRETLESEIVVSRGDASYFVLRMSAVARSEDDIHETLGIVASFTDITKHRELQQTKNEVLALVTHELRTPLTAIQGMSEILTEHTVDPEPQRKMLLTINAEAKRLAKMINEYLDVTRLESGTSEVRMTPIQIINLLEQTLLLLDPLAAKFAIKIERCFAAETPIIFADPDLLRQAVTNLVANAIKYSSEKTVVRIETRTASNMLLIIVRDEGFGIPAESLPRVFEKFYRVPRLLNAEVPGTGLGLSFVREVAEIHGGRVTAKSQLDKGSIFTIYLPLTPESSEESRTN